MRPRVTRVGALLASTRYKLGISIPELAKRIGTTKGWVSHLELGRKYPNDALYETLEKKVGFPARVVDAMKKAERLDRRDKKKCKESLHKEAE